MNKLLYGVAYYDEYMPYERLQEDVKMMKAAGINVVRIAESTWSTLEPQEGIFNFHHIDRVLAAMEAADIKVIIGTPTYAVPTWMVKAHPDVLAITPQGQSKYGPRQNMDITNPTYLYYSERVIRKLMEHVKDHPSVIGYQVDNETKHYNACGSNVQHRFIKYLKDKFENLEDLNKAYGFDYWSNRINDWNDFPDVTATINGSLSSEFARFQRSLVTEFLNWQAEIIREYKRDEQFITHNFDFAWRGHSFGIQTDVNHFDAARSLDIAGVDIYHPSQEELTGREISFGGDVARSMKRDNYFVIETEAQAFAGWVPFPGQLKLQAFSHLASGANMVSYWHWHSLHNAIETYWKGLLSHDFQPNPAYEEAKIIGKAFDRLSPKLINLKKQNKVAVLFSNESLTALNSFSGFNEGLEYNTILRRMYDALYNLNVPCDFIDPSSETIEDYSLILVPALYAAPDSLLNRLNTYVENGGNIIYGLRSGFTDDNVKVRASKQPGIIEKACGVSYSQFVSAKNVTLKDYTYEIDSAETNVQTLIELLTPTTAKILARYNHPYWGEYAAITQNQYGTGTATYIGCLPGAELMEAILKPLLTSTGLWDKDQELHFPLITKSGINQEGKKLHYYFNYSMEPHSFEYPHDSGTELLTESKITTREEILLEPWGIRIIEEI
ncbi:MAG: beta-galactosidase [Anaerocolumna sp.]|jgi:beta-galactosidase|nr:beta-galactosidase [Anaerocolumna sp.]